MNGVACKVSGIALAAVAAATLAVAPMQARPITHDEGVLPAGTELNEDQLDRPCSATCCSPRRAYSAAWRARRS
jgi:hypothetical protein